MLTLYDFGLSGNGYKVRLVLSLLGLPFRRIECDIMAGATRTPDFLALNGDGRIPVLVLEDGTALPESNAICWYLADGTDLVPGDRLGRAEVLRWQFFEQYSHEPNIAVLRFWRHLPALTATQQAQLTDKKARGEAALAVMERHLESRDWFVGRHLSLADIALYAYTHVAGEGGFDLARHPAIRAWLGRVAAVPGHVAIDDPIGLDESPAPAAAASA